MAKEVKYNLEERLIDFAVIISDIIERLPETRIGNYLAGQLVRSGTAPALNYGEAQSAESRNDFIHKMKIALKELRETSVCLRIIDRLNWVDAQSTIANLKECNELVAIFMKSIRT